ncbi:transmembrane and coiled-coil domain-containing protein 3 isoform X8 [Mirounga angustirostris]|uniref:transmembrane and coiled-coil domain-containing protein 3 isoform X8 n=1 Tax=Mirounga angustirostris TaxID=9716 RepID=UPI00313CDD16
MPTLLALGSPAHGTRHCIWYQEETEYVELLAAEKHQVEALKNMQHQNKSLSILDEILEDVRKAADRLEEEIEEHAFDDNKSVKGVNFEAVLRVEEEEANSKQNLTKREVEDDLGLSMLIDSQNNRYILTKPRDATIPRADHHFLKDIVTIGMLSLPCGWLCTTIGLPTMFGYIICGVLLGPSGLNSIKSVVQVETLGEVGVFFTLFLVGLEFSPERLRKVWKIALQGPCYMTLLMIAFGLLWGHLLQIRPTQSVFISTCLSLSSTPLVSRFLVGSARGEKEAGDIDYSAVLLGMLVVQDVQLGLFIAGMPTLIQAAAGTYSSVVMETLRILALVGQILFSLAAAFLLCLVIKTYLIGPYYRKLHMESKGNKEILILGISAFIFLMLMPHSCAPHHGPQRSEDSGSHGNSHGNVHSSCIRSSQRPPRCPSADAWLHQLWSVHTSEDHPGLKQRAQESPENYPEQEKPVPKVAYCVTELLDISMELGCFLAGALISSQGHMVTEEVVSYIEPIRDFLVIIFFASIGLHVFPTFVVYELTILMVLTLSVVIMKGVRRGLASVFCSAGRLGRGSNGSLSQFALAALVLSLLLPKSSQYVKWIVAAGLAQVSELSFVLGSRARRAGIISREVSLHPRCVFGEPRPAPPTLPSEHPARGSAAGAGPALCLSPSADDYCRCRRCPVPSRISGGRRAKSQGPPPLVCARPPWDRV